LYRLPEIGVRTLLVGGRYDECTPGHLEEMHRRIAGSRLVIIEDASHSASRNSRPVSTRPSVHLLPNEAGACLDNGACPGREPAGSGVPC